MFMLLWSERLICGNGICMLYGTCMLWCKSLVLLCSQSFEMKPNASKTIVQAQTKIIGHLVTGIWALMCVLPVIYVRGDWKYKFSTGMDVKSYSDIQCVVLVFSRLSGLHKRSRETRDVRLGDKSFKFVPPSWQVMSVYITSLRWLLSCLPWWGGIVEKEKKKSMSSSSPSHTNTYTSFSYVQRSNIRLLQLCCKIYFCIVCACLK